MSQSEDESLAYLLYRIVTVLRPHFATELEKIGIGMPEFVCLRILSMNPGKTSAELARQTGVSPQAMNQVLRALQDIGAVTRPTSTTRGRPLPARITRTGRSMLKQAQTAAHLADEKVLERLAPAERRKLKNLLYRAGADVVGGVAPTPTVNRTRSTLVP